MPDVKIIAEIAGRICAVQVDAGADVGEGDDVILVEAMKMEIPVPAPVSGRIKSILVKIDDIIAEGQPVAVMEASDV